MTDKELRKLNRRELLEILLEQSREIDRLRTRLEQAERQISDRQIVLDEAGSIAEASLQLNGVFKAAQQAADQYLESIGTLSRRQEEVCKKLETDSRRKADELLSGTQAMCEAMEIETREKCAKMTQEAQEKANLFWDEAQQKIWQLIDQQTGLRELLGGMVGEAAQK